MYRPKAHSGEGRGREGRERVKEGRERKGRGVEKGEERRGGSEGKGMCAPRMNSWLRLCRQVCCIDASRDI